MDNTQQFSYSDASAEEKKAFTDGMDELLNKLSLSINLVINKKGISIKGDNGQVEVGFMDQPMLLLQKKTPAPNAPVIKDAEIVSPLSDEMNGNEVSPKV